MGNALVEDYVHERNQYLNTINVMEATAKERGGKINDEDLEVVEKAQGKIRHLDKLIETFAHDMTMGQDMADKLARLQPGVAVATPMYRSAGELLFDCIHAEYGSAHSRDDQDAKERWGLTMKRAAQHMGTTAAATTPTAGGFGGLYVAPIVGPVIDMAPSGQPFLTLIGKQPAPNALTFNRPRILDPNFKTGAGVQALQKAELNSVKFDVAVDPLSLVTVGGYLNVSQQLMSLHPGAWDIILTQLQRRVAWAGEAAAINELDNSTATVALAAGATAATTLAALFAGAKLVYDNTGELPTWMVMGAGGWAMLGSLADTAGRPMFPWLGAANALGTANLGEFGLGPLGLNYAVTPGITTNDIWIGNANAIEAYSYSFPILEAIEPSVLGKQVAVAEALAMYRPITTEAAGANPALRNGAVRVGP